MLLKTSMHMNHSIVPFISGNCISPYTEATQTVLYNIESMGST